MKIKLLVEMFTLRVMAQYAEYCGGCWHGHTPRAGQPTLIAGYLGKGDQFDEAVADFATAYAEQMSAILRRCARRPARPYRNVHQKLRIWYEDTRYPRCSARTRHE
jgi:hypothetical protein